MITFSVILYEFKAEIYIYIVKVSGTTSSTVVFTLIIRVKGKFKNVECSHFIFCVANFHIVLFKYVDFL